MDIPPDLVITMNDIRRAGHCARGTRAWFDARPELPPFRDFLANGIPATDLAATGDGLALQVIQRALADPARASDDG